ncbi:LPS export ABC transporter permease LptG [Candidatus Sororendozoicomonas aggregata]|uniref:LPS export ABC transporter permease LptG n=1 Tax=Candidatus Sororendozoicomonas aggregata TaxID=3073239 RepID=UPI002ED4CBD7
MRKLDRYIARNVLGAMLVVMVGLVLLESLFAFLAQLEDLRASYGVADALLYVVLLIPKKMYEFIPVAALIGCLAGLGSMASNSELVVMRAAGVSLWRMVGAAMRPALVLVLIGVVIGEYIGPSSEQTAETRRTVARSSEGTYTGEGFWHREGNEYMYFNAVEPTNGIIYGVSLFRFDDSMRLTSSAYARRGVYQGDHWLLEDLKRSYFIDGRFETVEKKVERWDTNLTTTLLKVVLVKPEGLSISGLITYIRYLRHQGLETGEYDLALWTKVLQPLTIFSLMLVGIAFVFGPLRSVSMGLRIFTGVITGVVFMLVQKLLGPSSLVFGFFPILSVLLPALVCLVIGAVFLKRAA